MNYHRATQITDNSDWIGNVSPFPLLLTCSPGSLHHDQASPPLSHLVTEVMNDFYQIATAHRPWASPSVAGDDPSPLHPIAPLRASSSATAVIVKARLDFLACDCLVLARETFSLKPSQ